MRKLLSTSCFLFAILSGASWAEDTVEVLHWWTSGSEAKALELLKQDLETKGVRWKDMPISGGSGQAAMMVLRARVNAGNAPAAVQMQAFDIQDWAREGVLADLDSVAQEGNWDQKIPDAVKQFSKYQGHWVAAPVNIHSTNWMWVNKQAFDRAGGKAPKSFDELVAMLNHFRGQGLIPIAAGGQAWQDATLFDAVVLSLGGEFYREALIELSEDALSSDMMRQAFERMSVLRGYVDNNFSDREWNLASAMVIDGKAGVQFMGDWAKGEFLAAGKRPDVDFVCLRFPETNGAVTFVADQFAMFKLNGSGAQSQMKMAAALESETFQSAFSVIKGSAPVQIGVSSKDFDDCGIRAISDLKEASARGQLLGSLAHGHAAPTAVKLAIFDVVTRHFNGELDSAEAVEELVLAVRMSK